ncbi:hypothetical protein HRbin23_00054 [bacterium HR23]|nr:hypothetical protein HRbin23_00054 [bacterium HR23]
MLKGRLEEELEEILRKAEIRHRLKARRAWRWPRVSLRLSPGFLLVAGVVVLLLALVAPRPLTGWRVWLFWGGLGLLVLAYGVYWRGQRPKVEKRWRGRPIDTPPGRWERRRWRFRR